MTRAILEGNGQTFSFRTTKYDVELKDELKALVPSACRSWNRGERGYGYRRRGTPGYWEISSQYWEPVKDLCKQYGLKVEASGPIKQPKEQTAIIELDYMGLVRHRGGDTYTASGWVNGGWNVTFPMDVLQSWFGFSVKPGEMPTLYAVLSIGNKVTGREIKSAYRRAARTWHPDVCKEPDAEEQFKQIQHAYEKLQDPMFRKKYDAGLSYQKSVNKDSSMVDTTAIEWKPPVRCGRLKVRAIATQTAYDTKYIVNEILGWEDTVNSYGETRITYWSMRLSGYKEKWVR